VDFRATRISFDVAQRTHRSTAARSEHFDVQLYFYAFIGLDAFQSFQNRVQRQLADGVGPGVAV
jgi:Uri superfamily endonuclease